jgi:hypothetical protein
MATIKGVRERPILFSGPMVRAILDGKKTQTRRVVNPQPVLNLDTDDVAEIGSPESLVLGYFSGSTPYRWSAKDGSPEETPCPYGIPSDRLWVRETWATGKALDGKSPKKIATSCLDAGYAKPWAPIWYEADGSRPDNETANTFEGKGKSRPSIFMPRWASRILLDVVDVRVERLNDISEMDARAEGISQVTFIPDDGFPPSLGYMVGKDDGKSPLHTSAKECFKKLWDDINGERAPWSSNPWVWVVTFKRVEEASHGDL